MDDKHSWVIITCAIAIFMTIFYHVVMVKLLDVLFFDIGYKLVINIINNPIFVSTIIGMISMILKCKKKGEE
tara:strand:- start:561 stop:776 length:216 start_codon:yes stop_codon:yes gene_type:complete